MEFTSEDYAKIMLTNIESAFHISQIAYPLLKASGLGSIVLISSVVHIGRGSLIYSSTKGALNQLTRNLACEWAGDNIRTNCVASLVEPVLKKKDFVEEAEEVASLVAFLRPLTSPDRSFPLMEDSP